MRQQRESRDIVRFDLAAGGGIWDTRRAEDPRVIRLSLALGALGALALATGGGVVRGIDWAAAGFCGLALAVLARGAMLARHYLRQGGWQRWRERRANEPVADRLGLGLGVALACFLVTGGGGIGPAFPPGESLVIGGIAGIAARALLTFARWP